MRVFRITALVVTLVLLFATVVPAEAAAPWKRQMRIGLYHLGVPRQFEVSSTDGPLEVYDPFSRTVLLSGPATGATVICRDGRMQVFMPSRNAITAPYPLVFSALGSKQPALRISTPPYRGETYRGSLALAPWRDRLFAVNLVDIEEYLRSVVPAEIGGRAPTAALEAQAVAARSYALRNHQRHGPNGFDLCDEVHCQVYRGLRTETTAATQAVQRTAGWALTYGAFLANTVYHANCGGRLASSQDVWKGAPVAYLCEHPDRLGNGRFFCAPDEGKSSSARSSKTKRATGKTASPSPKSKPPVSTAGAQLRHHPSRGHRVGLCQDGAIGMAKQGYDGAGILRFYYPGTTLTSITSNLQLAHLTKTPGSASTPPAAPRFGSGRVRTAAAHVRHSPAKRPPLKDSAQTVRTSSEPTEFALNLRKWFWTALPPHSSAHDMQIVSAAGPKPKKGKKSVESKKKILLSSAARSDGRSSSKSTRRNARR